MAGGDAEGALGEVLRLVEPSVDDEERLGTAEHVVVVRILLKRLHHEARCRTKIALAFSVARRQEITELGLRQRVVRRRTRVGATDQRQDYGKGGQRPPATGGDHAENSRLHEVLDPIGSAGAGGPPRYRGPQKENPAKFPPQGHVNCWF